MLNHDVGSSAPDDVLTETISYMCGHGDDYIKATFRAGTSSAVMRKIVGGMERLWEEKAVIVANDPDDMDYGNVTVINLAEL